MLFYTSHNGFEGEKLYSFSLAAIEVGKISIFPLNGMVWLRNGNYTVNHIVG